MSEKTAALEAEAFKTKRNFEETAILKRKVERLKKIEMATDKDMDEILKEEIREYKETLTCPSCKVKRKDAILTKCFHVFCYDCLRYVPNMFIIRDLTMMSLQDTLRDQTEEMSKVQCRLRSLRLSPPVFILTFKINFSCVVNK